MKFDLKITVAVAAALLAAACEQQPPKPQEWTASADTALCVDKDGKRIPDTNCQGKPGERVQERHGSGMGTAAALFGAWYFLGRGQRIGPMGAPVVGGSFAPRPGAAYGRAAGFTSVSRGMFGSSGRGFGGGAGE